MQEPTSEQPEKKPRKRKKSRKDIEIERLKEELESARKEAGELKALAQRIQADFDNYRKRTVRENEMKERYGCESLIIRILDVVDTLERAISHEKGDFREGLEMIRAQLESVLSEFGVEPIDALGNRFDPRFHEAIATGEGEEEGMVLEEYQKGYMLYDRVIRHSKVKVSRR